MNTEINSVDCALNFSKARDSAEIYASICDEKWSLEDEKSSSKIPDLVQDFAYIR